MKKGAQRILMVVGIIALNILLDQLTKGWARENLQYHVPKSYWGDFFRLTYVENKGAFLSLGSDLSENVRYWVLHLFPVLLLGALTLYAMLSTTLNRWQIIAMSFIIGGGISNVYDRLLYGQVTDFMNMGAFGVRTGIFNFADVSIMAGLFIMLPFAFQKDPTEEDAATEEE